MENIKNQATIETDMLIVGAGPVGLFTVFEAGLLQIKCHLIDALPQIGGQLAEIYPKKPIYDIPGAPGILAADLVDNLLVQIKEFEPGFSLAEKAESYERLEDGGFIVYGDQGTNIKCKVIVIAAGLGAFEPRKPPLKNLEKYEGNGLAYFVKDPDDFKGKKMVIAGGGDSALDWANYFVEQGEEVSLVHRRSSFRAAPDSVEKAMNYAHEGRLNMLTNSQVVGLLGESKLKGVVIQNNEHGELQLDADCFLPLFGLAPKMGPLANWGFETEKNSIVVDNVKFETNVPGIFAVGDINTYPGKLKLILCGFHEATLMCQAAFPHIFPDKKLSFKYTTVMGETGLIKNAEKLKND